MVERSCHTILPAVAAPPPDPHEVRRAVVVTRIRATPRQGPEMVETSVVSTCVSGGSTIQRDGLTALVKDNPPRRPPSETMLLRSMSAVYCSLRAFLEPETEL